MIHFSYAHVSFIFLRYLRSVSILTFMNKIDILKQKIESGCDFASAIEKVRVQAGMLSTDSQSYSEFERGIYSDIYDILNSNPYPKFLPTGKLKYSTTIISSIIPTKIPESKA